MYILIVFFIFTYTLKHSLQTDFSKVADQLAIQSYFYNTDKSALPVNVKTTNENTVLVFKDGAYFEYTGKCVYIACNVL